MAYTMNQGEAPMQTVLEIGRCPDMSQNIGFDALPKAHHDCGRFVPNGARLDPQRRLICEGCGCQITIDDEEAHKIQLAAIRPPEQPVVVSCWVNRVYQRILVSIQP